MNDLEPNSVQQSHQSNIKDYQRFKVVTDYSITICILLTPRISELHSCKEIPGAKIIDRSKEARTWNSTGHQEQAFVKIALENVS